MPSPFAVEVRPDAESFLKCVARKAAPKRVHSIELFLDAEIQDAIVSHYGLEAGLKKEDPAFFFKRQIALQRFLGYDYVLAGVDNLAFNFTWHNTEDPTELQKTGGRRFMDETRGPVTTWEEFEKYPWPKLAEASTKRLEWYNRNLPDDMCLIGGLTGHIAEEITFFMGYETLCIALYEQPDLVRAILDKVVALHTHYVNLLLQFDRVRAVWASDDMGFKTGPLLSPGQFREFVFPAHKALAKTTHDAGRLYFLHACGKLDLIMRDLIDDVKIDAKHSFEDTIENVADARAQYGQDIALFGGIDVDFLCRSNEAAVRTRVRRTLDKCQGAGYCLGTGNSVANYIPLDNYLTMLDEGRRYSR
ncbi:MAG: uroporphyrinogen decarboxylase family protein [Fibrobacterota bacterium]